MPRKAHESLRSSLSFQQRSSLRAQLRRLDAFRVSPLIEPDSIRQSITARRFFPQKSARICSMQSQQECAWDGTERRERGGRGHGGCRRWIAQILLRLGAQRNLGIYPSWEGQTNAAVASVTLYNNSSVGIL